jgi:hypothetical protein
LPGQAFGNGDFTVEYWQNISASVTTGCAFAGVSTTNFATYAGWAVGYYTAGIVMQLAFAVNGGYYPSAYVSVDGLWHAVAWVRKAGVLTCYYDGVGAVIVPSGTPNFTDSTSAFHIGNVFNSGALQNPNGLIDELRVSTTALYTSNYTPTGPFTS